MFRRPIWPCGIVVLNPFRRSDHVFFSATTILFRQHPAQPAAARCSGFLCSRSPPARARPRPVAASNVAYYTCTMHPFVRSQDPTGHCPVCGMSLVPVYKSDAPDNERRARPHRAVSVDNGMVNIAPERMQEIGVTTEVVTKRALTHLLRAPARAEIDESSLRDINVKAGAGYITKLYANYEGMSFQQGPAVDDRALRGLAANPDRLHQGLPRVEALAALVSPNNSFALDNKLELMRARIRVWDLSQDQIAGAGKIRSEHERNRPAHRPRPLRQLRRPRAVRRLRPRKESNRGHALRGRANRSSSWPITAASGSSRSSRKTRRCTSTSARR
jgi:hypothetical protein